METRPGRNGGRLKLSRKGDPSPNPSGRPKGSLSAKTIIRRWMEAEEKGENPLNGCTELLTQMDLITLAQLCKAKKGDTSAFNALLDRLEGKPRQITEEVGGNQVINVNIVDESG